jgi:hypothetical protein
LSEKLSSGVTEVKCYPNPFDDRIHIEVKLAKDLKLQLGIMNQLGQEIKVLMKPELLKQSRYTFTWDGTNYNRTGVSAGLYYLRIIADDEVLIRKIVLSK